MVASKGSQDPVRIKERRYTIEEAEKRAMLPEFDVNLHDAYEFIPIPVEYLLVSPPSVAPEQAIYYELQHWADQGLLGYLDYAQPDLPLRIGIGTRLPEIYQNIPGRCAKL